MSLPGHTEEMEVDPEEPSFIFVGGGDEEKTTPIVEIPSSDDMRTNGPLGVTDIVHGGMSSCEKLGSQVSFADNMIINWTPKVRNDALFNPKKNSPTWLYSPVITHGHPTLLTPTRWKIQFSTDYFYENRTRTVAIYLWRLPNNFEDYMRHSDGIDDVQCLYQVDILDNHGQSVFTKASGFRSISRDQHCGWKNVAPYEKVEPYLTNGRINLRVELKTVEYFPNLNLTQFNKMITVKILDSKICTLNKAVLMQKCKDFRNRVLDGDDSDEVVLPSELLEKFTIRTVQNMFQYLGEGSCPFVRDKASRQLPELWDMACDLSQEELKVDIFEALTEGISIANVTALVIFVCQNSHIIRQPNSQYAKFYNKIKRFVLENMEGISKSGSFKRCVETNTECAEEFANLVWEKDLMEPVQTR